MANVEGWSVKRSKGQTKAERHTKLVADLEEAMAAKARAANISGSIGDRGFAVDTARDILDDRVA
eukprot:4813588-Heterocapsa_arctica.AAC.1